MTDREISKLKNQLEKIRARVAKERDALRDLIADAGALAEACDEAVVSMEDAADKLSELQ